MSHIASYLGDLGLTTIPVDGSFIGVVPTHGFIKLKHETPADQQYGSAYNI